MTIAKCIFCGRDHGVSFDVARGMVCWACRNNPEVRDEIAAIVAKHTPEPDYRSVAQRIDDAEISDCLSDD